MFGYIYHIYYVNYMDNTVILIFVGQKSIFSLLAKRTLSASVAG